MNKFRLWTNEEDRYLNEHYATASYEELTNHLQRTKRSILDRAGKLCLYRRATEYALYKGDSILAHGTMKEITKQLDVSDNHLWRLNSPSYAKSVKKSSMHLVKL